MTLNDIYEEEDELLNSNKEQYFLFLSDGDVYGLPALSVDEILENQSVTKVPFLNRSILGVTNVRGTIVGVVDLMDRLQQRQSYVSSKTSLAIINCFQNNKHDKIAIMIDEIFEVDGLDDDSIQSVPPFGTKIKAEFIKSIAKYNNRDIYILDIDKVLDTEVLSKLEEINEDDDLSSYIMPRTNKEALFNFDDEDEEDDELDISKLVVANSNEASQYLVFIGPNNQYYAKNISKIDEIIDYSGIDIQKNFDKNMIMGVANIRGEMLTLVNFDLWLGATYDDTVKYNEIIIANFGKHKFGLAVREISFIVHIDQSKMTKSSDADSKSTFISTIEVDGQDVMCTVVDSDQIIIDTFKTQHEQNELELEMIVDTIESDKFVLFADDSVLIRNTIQKAAEKLGIKYKIFENGQELFDVLENNQNDDVALIVTDLEMPVLGGYKLIENIRSNSQYNDIKIIVYTNMANDTLADELLKIGANKVVPKISVQSLNKAIRELM